MIQSMGKKGVNFFLFAGTIGVMSARFLRALFRWPFEGKEFIKQIYAVGVKSLPLAIITGTSIGMVMTLQFAYGLQKYGVINEVPKLVAYAMVRELGPVFIALLVGGKIASGFAAELGSMKVTEQIDAIRALGGDPVKKLIVPRVVAVLFVLPLLTLLADMFSFLGGSLIAFLEYSIDPYTYMRIVQGTLKNREIVHSILKTLTFAYLIALAGSIKGFTTGYGSKAVGQSTTETVQFAFVFVLISDFFLTKMFMVVKFTFLDYIY